VLCGRADEAVRLLEQVLSKATSSGRMVSGASAFTGRGAIAAGRLDGGAHACRPCPRHARTYQQRGHGAMPCAPGRHCTYVIPGGRRADASYRQPYALADELEYAPTRGPLYLGLGSLYAKMDSGSRPAPSYCRH